MTDLLLDDNKMRINVPLATIVFSGGRKFARFSTLSFDKKEPGTMDLDIFTGEHAPEAAKEIKKLKSGERFGFSGFCVLGEQHNLGVYVTDAILLD